jgi:hypothetical protein
VLGIKEAAGKHSGAHRMDLNVTAFCDLDPIGVVVKALEGGGLFDTTFEDFAGCGLVAQKVQFGLLERALLGLDRESVVAGRKVRIKATVLALAAVIVVCEHTAPAVKEITEGVLFARCLDAKLSFVFDTKHNGMLLLLIDLKDFAFLNDALCGLCGDDPCEASETQEDTDKPSWGLAVLLVTAHGGDSCPLLFGRGVWFVYEKRETPDERGMIMQTIRITMTLDVWWCTCLCGKNALCVA